MIRVRFHTVAEDYRPVKWPVKHPYWKTGEDADGRSVIVTYADNEHYVLSNWPEAEGMEAEHASSYNFTDRFPRPEWFAEGPADG